MCSPPMDTARAKAPKRKKPIVKPTVEAIPETSYNGDSKFARALGSRSVRPLTRRLINIPCARVFWPSAVERPSCKLALHMLTQ